MERYVETTLWKKDTEVCDLCGASKSKTTQKKNCCKEEHKQVKLDKDHQAAEQTVKQFQLIAELLLFPTQRLMPTPALADIAHTLPPSHAPPKKEYCCLYRLNCIYRI